MCFPLIGVISKCREASVARFALMFIGLETHPGLPAKHVRLIPMKFYTWLMKNRWRADLIGDIARDVHADARWPKTANAWADVKEALPSTACDGARDALRAAWAEYELYVGGPSHLKPNMWVSGVIGNAGLRPPKEYPEKT